MQEHADTPAQAQAPPVGATGSQAQAMRPAAPAGAVNTPADVAALFAQAARTSSEAARAAERRDVEAFRALAQAANAAQNALGAAVLAGLRDAVMTAAAAGHREAVVMSFQGNETFAVPTAPDDAPDDAQSDAPAQPVALCYLFLLKGPRDVTERRRLVAHGFEPMLMRMRRELAPFRVTHRWDQATNGNAVVVSWA